MYTPVLSFAAYPDVSLAGLGLSSIGYALQQASHCQIIRSAREKRGDVISSDALIILANSLSSSVDESYPMSLVNKKYRNRK
jgi:hypothetical protein